jgi:hypothetical protein
MSPVITVPDVVRQAIGADAARQTAQVGSLAGGRCPICQDALPEQGPATVVVVRGGTVLRASFAHNDCAARVHPVLDITPEEALRTWDEGLDMGLVTVMLEFGGGHLPGLVAHLTTANAWAVNESTGELTSLITSGLLERGWSLVTRFRQAPRAMPAGWLVTIDGPPQDGPATVNITDADGVLFYVGTADLPDGWTALAQRLTWCAAFSGNVQYPDDMAAGNRALRTAANKGGLVGARLPVTWTE